MRVRRVGISVHDERGIAAVVVMVSMVFIVAMLGLVIDGGNLFGHRRAIVNAADAAALGAAQAYSRAEGGAACGSNDGPAMSAADSAASGNISSSTRILYQCPSSAGAGTVKVGYQATVSGLFSSGHEVDAAATASWGATLGGPGLLPFQLDSSQVEGACGVPSPNPGATCFFWYAPNNTSSQWGFLNLCSADAAAHGFCPANKVGWNVSLSTQCPNTGSISKTVIANGFAYALTMNNPPPTYVCIDTGFSQVDFASIRVGTIGVFPVAQPPPILKNGNPDKYRIIGFTALKILFVGRGNDSATTNPANCGPLPAWITSPPSTAECIKMQWIGPQEVPGDICPTCVDLGVHSIKLSG
jgi:Flp pilus assembly protein TadG